jgi:hypothetical protein
MDRPGCLAEQLQIRKMVIPVGSTTTRSFGKVGGLLAIASAAVVIGGFVTTASAATSQENIPGNPDCADLGFDNEFKIQGGEFPAEGTYEPGDPGTESKGDTTGFSVEITYTDNDPLTFDFESTIAVGAVLVKAGTSANAYSFDPPSTMGTGLVSPVDDSISHISFCWDTGTPTTTTLPGDTTTTTVPGEGGVGPVPPPATPIEEPPPTTG